MLQSTFVSLSTSAVTGALAAGLTVAAKALVDRFRARRKCLPGRPTEVLTSVAPPATPPPMPAAAHVASAQVAPPPAPPDRRRADALRDLHEAIVPCEDSLRGLVSQSDALGDANQLAKLGQTLLAMKSMLDVLGRNRLWLTSETARAVDPMVRSYDDLVSARDAAIEAVRNGKGFAGALQGLRQRLVASADSLSGLRNQLEAEFRSAIGIT